MKRTVMTLLAFTLLLAGASAQVTKRLNRLEVTFADTLKLDSLYNFWNAYVQLHPKDEMAWRNLFDASEGKVHDMIYRTRDWDGCERYRKQLNVVGRMEKAIPDSYTFYYLTISALTVCRMMPMLMTMKHGYHTSSKSVTLLG